MLNPEFVFTLSDLTAWVLAVCGMITAVAAAVAVIIKFTNFLKKPNKDQDDKIVKLNDRVSALEAQTVKFLGLFETDKKRLDEQEKSLNMLLQGTFALLGHELNGNNTEQMHDTFNEMQNYLFKRKG